jgi:hypothetical protein
VIRQLDTANGYSLSGHPVRRDLKTPIERTAR